MDTLAIRLRKARTKKGWSQSELARKVGIKPQAIQAIEAGKVLRPRHIVPISNALGVDPNYFEENGIVSSIGEHKAIASKMVPIVGVARAGLDNIDYSTGHGGLGDVEAPSGATPQTVAIEVTGTSMGARVEDGDIVFYDDRREPVTDDLIGRLCVVGCADGRVLIKRLRYGSRPGLFHLISYTEEPEFDVSVMWAARITNIRPR